MIERELKPEEKLDKRINDPELKVLAGSRLYGTHDEDSDYDYRGFIIPPREYRLELYNSGGENYKFENHDVNNDSDGDTSIFSFRKFMKLLLDGNAFCVELLFANKENIINCSNFGWWLIANRHRLVSKNVYKPFKEFGKGSFHMAMNRSNPNAIWKDLYHSLRVLGEGIELFETGNITFPRPEEERELLYAVKHQDTTIDAVKKEFKKRYNKIEREFNKSKTLRKKPDYDFVNELILEVSHK